MNNSFWFYHKTDNAKSQVDLLRIDPLTFGEAASPRNGYIKWKDRNMGIDLIPIPSLLWTFHSVPAYERTSGYYRYLHAEEMIVPS